MRGRFRTRRASLAVCLAFAQPHAGPKVDLAIAPSTVQMQMMVNGNVVQKEETATFQLPKDQKVAKLVFSGSRSVAVEVPFTLKNVTLP